jgi:hypothetical protein
MSEMTKSEFAAHIGVSKGRVSQFLKEGKLFGDAIVGTGRRARICAPIASEQLRRTLNLDRRLGANGRVKLDGEPPAAPLLPTLPTPPANPLALLEDEIRRENLERVRLANEESREKKAERAGRYVRSADVKQQMGRLAASMVNLFEGALGEFATAIAAQSGMASRDALHVLRSTFRAVRERHERAESQAAAALPVLVEDSEAEELAATAPAAELAI